MRVIVHYAEIALKGKNRSYFEGRLMKNIRHSMAREGFSIHLQKENTRLVGQLENACEEADLAAILRKIPGIKHFSLAVQAERSMDGILHAADAYLRRFAGKQLAVITKRADKAFPYTSMEISRAIGTKAAEYGIKINFANPDHTLYTEVTKQNAYLFDHKSPGLSGLPVGASGRVLSMLSGGIDSPAASWLMAKRGCQVDFLHFHTFNRGELVLQSKIKTLIEILNQYQYRARLFLVPYATYQILSMGHVKWNYDLVLFRHFMFRFAERLALEHGYQALVTGDNVGQVASQTLDNLRAAAHQVTLPIMRPLVAMEKDEIVQLARKIGTFEAGTAPYKDCCSIIARAPHTAVKLERLQHILEQMDLDSIIDRSLAETEIVNISSYQPFVSAPAYS